MRAARRVHFQRSNAFTVSFSFDCVAKLLSYTERAANRFHADDWAAGIRGHYGDVPKADKAKEKRLLQGGVLHAIEFKFIDLAVQDAAVSAEPLTSDFIFEAAGSDPADHDGDDWQGRTNGDERSIRVTGGDDAADADCNGEHVKQEVHPLGGSSRPEGGFRGGLNGAVVSRVHGIQIQP